MADKEICRECGKRPAKTEGKCGWCLRRIGGGSKPPKLKKKDLDLMAVTVNSSERNQKISVAFDLDINISNVRIAGIRPAETADTKE